MDTTSAQGAHRARRHPVRLEHPLHLELRPGTPSTPLPPLESRRRGHGALRGWDTPPSTPVGPWPRPADSTGGHRRPGCLFPHRRIADAPGRRPEPRPPRPPRRTTPGRRAAGWRSTSPLPGPRRPGARAPGHPAPATGRARRPAPPPDRPPATPAPPGRACTPPSGSATHRNNPPAAAHTRSEPFCPPFGPSNPNADTVTHAPPDRPATAATYPGLAPSSTMSHTTSASPASPPRSTS